MGVRVRRGGRGTGSAAHEGGGGRTSGGPGPGPPPVMDHCRRRSTDCGDWLAWANIAVPAWDRICDLVKATIS